MGYAFGVLERGEAYVPVRCGMDAGQPPGTHAMSATTRPTNREESYSASSTPEPPIFLGTSLCFGKPSLTGSTVS